MDPVDQILALTDQVQQYIDEGRWAEAGALEKERLALLTVFFQCDTGESLGPQREQLARDLLTSNVQMTEMVKEHRGHLRETARRVVIASSAVSAYRRNGSPSQRDQIRWPSVVLPD